MPTAPFPASSPPRRPAPPAGRMTAVVAVLVRLAVHRALRPVVRISDDVAAITDAGEDRRVRVPAADDEIAHLARTMNGTLERLACSDAARKRFIADASHDLRSPVATLQIHVETAPPGPAGPQGAPGSPGAPAAPGATALIDREVVSGEVRRLAGLVEDLLTAAKGDAGGLELRMADCDLDDVVLAEVRRLRAVTHHEVRLRLDAAQVRGDAGRLAQVLRNLLDNANRHSRGWIAVTVEPTSQGGADIVRVHVDNEGPALPPRAARAGLRALRPPRRVPLARPRRLRPRPGHRPHARGSPRGDPRRRRVPRGLLPHDPHPAPHRRRAGAPSRHHPPHRSNVMRILLVEDEVPLAQAIQRGLAQEGMVVDICHNGVDGLWLATENPYDVVVLDIMLPGHSGYTILERMRAAGVWTPVLMLTAKDGEYDEADAFDLSADDYLTKPFHFVVLVARLRALVRRGAPERPVVIEAGALALDPVAKTVRVAGQEVALTAKQYALLHYLARHVGEPVSKAEILDNVWGSDFEGSENIVEVYMRNLRRKIDIPFERHSLETLRGIGYRLAAV